MADDQKQAKPAAPAAPTSILDEALEGAKPKSKRKGTEVKAYIAFARSTNDEHDAVISALDAAALAKGFARNALGIRLLGAVLEREGYLERNADGEFRLAE